jgi:hypothetical protein
MSFKNVRTIFFTIKLLTRVFYVNGKLKKKLSYHLVILPVSCYLNHLFSLLSLDVKSVPTYYVRRV